MAFNAGGIVARLTRVEGELGISLVRRRVCGLNRSVAVRAITPKSARILYVLDLA